MSTTSESQTADAVHKDLDPIGQCEWGNGQVGPKYLDLTRDIWIPVVPVSVARQLETERDETELKYETLVARIEDRIEKVARKKEFAVSNYDRVCADLLDGCLRSLLVSEHRETRELFPGTLEALDDLVDGCFAPGATKITEEISTSGEGVN